MEIKRFGKRFIKTSRRLSLASTQNGHYDVYKKRISNFLQRFHNIPKMFYKRFVFAGLSLTDFTG